MKYRQQQQGAQISLTYQLLAINLSFRSVKKGKNYEALKTTVIYSSCNSRQGHLWHIYKQGQYYADLSWGDFTFTFSLQSLHGSTLLNSSSGKTREARRHFPNFSIQCLCLTVRIKGLIIWSFRKPTENRTTFLSSHWERSSLAGFPGILPLSIDVVTSRCPSSLNTDVWEIVSVL